MSADKRKGSGSSERYPDDRGVGGILSGYQRPHPEPTKSTPAEEQGRAPSSGQTAPQSPASEKEPGKQPTKEKERVLYHLPKTHIAALDEIKAELKGHRGYSARDASYSAIVTQAIERYYTDLFPDRNPPGW